jgi:hypothetical protein
MDPNVKYDPATALPLSAEEPDYRKRSYTSPAFFTEGGRLFAEFADGSVYGIITRIKWVNGAPVQRRQYIRISDDTPRTPA